MTDACSAAARRAVRALHETVAALPIETHLYQIMTALPDLPGHVLYTAWNPHAELLLASGVYLGIARACGATELEISRILRLYLTARLAFDRDPDPDQLEDDTGAPRTGTPLPQELAPGAQPGVPRVPLLGTAARRPTPMGWSRIRSRDEFTRHLVTLRAHSRLSVRQIVEATRQLEPDHHIPRSTLQDALNRGSIPCTEHGMEALFTVLFGDLADDKTEPQDVSVQVHTAMQAWRRVARLPALPVTEADRTRTVSPVLDKALAELARAERTAAQAGSIDAAGLAHAQRILRELFP